MAKNIIDYEKLIAIASTKTFTEMGTLVSVEGELSYDVSDNGDSNDNMWADAQAEFLLLSILSQLTDKQKIILLYQVLRESGYKLRHEDCAKTINVSREWYMTILKDTMKKSRKALQNQLK